MSVEFLKTDFEKISYLVNLLIDRSTGGNPSDNEFTRLRHELLSNEKIVNLLPAWLKTHRNLNSFWNFIKQKFDSYAKRRTFLNKEFSDVLDLIEFGHIGVLKTNLEHSAMPTSIFTNKNPNIKKKVFIVHGRDNEAKQEVSRYIESLGIEVIILHEQASGGRTIIEKIEYYANEAFFALVLYTACDKGRGCHETKVPARNRARQNVIFEHGYLISKLGRKNVCALVKGEIETPNDISGIVYTDFDLAGAWKTEVKRELKECGYTI
jgi:predicted nucleotide-binding protein